MAKKAYVKKEVVPERYERLDALRGLAIVWMTIFHFCFDLSYFGFIKQNFYTDPKWTWQRAAIVSFFLFCAGSGQAVAFAKGLDWSYFLKRWRQVVAGAVVVSIGSYFVFPNSFIYFGILHGIALMLFILKFVAAWSYGLIVLGVLIISLQWVAPMAHSLLPGLEVLNSPWLNWIGFVSRKPITEDYVPLIPWLGVLFIGYAVGQWILRNKASWFKGELRSNFSWLAVLGKWSLSYYIIHQPVLFSIVYLLKYITG